MAGEKLIMLPLTIMFVLALISGAGTEGSWSFYGVEISLGGSMWLWVGILTVLGLGVILAGIELFGSGLAETSLKVIFKLGGLGAAWIILAGFSYEVISSIPYIGVWTWISMTFAYFLGLMLHTLGGGGG